MSERMSIGHLYPTNRGPIGAKPTQSTDVKESTSGFKEILSSNLLKFSHHAEVRMQQRGIHLQPEQLNRILSAIEQADAKGAKDSLVLFKDIAMIVNVPSRTVVTALDGKSMQGNVFTQIDSAVVVN